MPRVTVQPHGISFDVPAGETIMAAAKRQGHGWPSACGGEGRCTSCACLVLSGMEHVSPRGRSEERVLVEERGPRILDKAIRLACQARISGGDVVVEKPAIRPPFTLPSGHMSGVADEGAEQT